MPKKWFSEEYSGRRKSCKVPENLTFKTKTQMVSEMIKTALDSRLFPAKWIGVDSSFGNDKSFLDGLPEGINYFADVHATFASTLYYYSIVPRLADKIREKTETRLNEIVPEVWDEEDR